MQGHGHGPCRHLPTTSLPLQAVFKIVGSTTKFPKTKKEYVDWGDEIEGNDGSSCRRFLGGAEPYKERMTLHEAEEPGQQQQ